MKIQNYKKKTD